MRRTDERDRADGCQAYRVDSSDCKALPQAFSIWGTEMTLVERRELSQALEPQEFKDGAVLIKQGEPRDAGFFIIVQEQVSCTPRRDHRCEVLESAPSAPPFCSAFPARASPPRHGSASARGRPSAPPGKAVHRGARPRAPQRPPGALRLRALLRPPISRARTPQARRGRERGQARLLADQPAVRVHRDRGR